MTTFLDRLLARRGANIHRPTPPDGCRENRNTFILQMLNLSFHLIRSAELFTWPGLHFYCRRWIYVTGTQRT